MLQRATDEFAWPLWEESQLWASSPLLHSWPPFPGCYKNATADWASRSSRSERIETRVMNIGQCSVHAGIFQCLSYSIQNHLRVKRVHCNSPVIYSFQSGKQTAHFVNKALFGSLAALGAELRPVMTKPLPEKDLYLEMVWCLPGTVAFFLVSLSL